MNSSDFDNNNKEVWVIARVVQGRPNQPLDHGGGLISLDSQFEEWSNHPTTIYVHFYFYFLSGFELKYEVLH
jgi:hypothetical protein